MVGADAKVGGMIDSPTARLVGTFSLTGLLTYTQALMTQLVSCAARLYCILVKNEYCSS